MVPKPGHPFLWLWGPGSSDPSFILCFDFSSAGLCRAADFRYLTHKGNWNHVLAPSLTFEIRDDVFTLNRLRFFTPVETFSRVSGEDFC